MSIQAIESPGNGTEMDLGFSKPGIILNFEQNNDKHPYISDIYYFF